MNLSSAFRRAGNLAAPLLDLVYPPRCLGCDAPIHSGDVLCGKCAGDMMELHIGEDGSQELIESLTYPPAATFIAAGYDYEKESVIETCLHTLKYKGMHSVGEWLGRLLGERMYGTPILDGEPVLVPVPLNKTKQLERGYNQSEYIARGIAAETGLAIEPGVLYRTRYTESQSASLLTQEERKANLEGAFAVREEAAERIAPSPVIVVDDIITTGATLGECVRALNAAGIADVRIAAVAHPLRR